MRLTLMIGTCALALGCTPDPPSRSGRGSLIGPSDPGGEGEGEKVTPPAEGEGEVDPGEGEGEGEVVTPPVECEPGLERCDGACVDTRSDAANCGACGDACEEGQECADGGCILLCEEGLVRCGGEVECIDLQSSQAHCSECDRPCQPGDDCHDGVCGLRCRPWERFCDSVCLSTVADNENCGACGVTCDAEIDTCRDGECVYRCGDEEIICNGACADLETNSHHCGECGARCGVHQDCVEGECVIACPVTHTRCGDQCVDTMRSSSHCGGCNQVCDGWLICRQGGCECDNPQLVDCNELCRDLSADQQNCGECGDLCPDDQVCADSECTCELDGFEVCGGRCLNVRGEDITNCGGCDEVCEEGVECQNGFCGLGDFLLIEGWGDWNWFRVPIEGQMLDANIRDTCEAMGLEVPCAGQGGCNYNDNLCAITDEAGCGNPMQGVARQVCDGANPPQCPALNNPGTFQYMGGGWQNGSACGAVQGQWCATGNQHRDLGALCVGRVGGEDE